MFDGATSSTSITRAWRYSTFERHGITLGKMLANCFACHETM